MWRVDETLHGGPVDAEEFARIRDVVLFEQPGLRARLVRFAALLILASAIATYGLLGDSVAAVIGAMIVAPLMLPIMGLAFGISIGDRKAIVGSLMVALAGIAAAIVVGLLLSLPFSWIDVTANTQIMSRTAPRLIDLCAALATGLAGAFAIGRKDVSDTLPGVAIAISLVPPLANVGILLGAGRPDLAMGSLLLFVTNYLAIVLTGAFMFGLMGYPRAALANRSARAKQTAIAIVVTLALLITIPLAAASYNFARTSIAERAIAQATRTWLDGTGYRFVSTTAAPDVHLTITGEGTLPPVSELQSRLGGQLRGQTIKLEVVPNTSYVVTTR
jgi:uncharacterized hydrophobic protein (TIGR00271 family)